MATNTEVKPARGGKAATSSRAKPLVMDSFADEILWFYSQRKSRSMPGKVTRVLNLLREVGVRTTADLNDGAIQRLEAVLPSDVKATTRDNILSICRAMCNNAVSLGLLPSCPAFPPIVSPKHHPRVKPDAPLTHEEVKRLWHHLEEKKDDWFGHRLFALFALAVLAGLLREELFEMETGDVDLDEGTIKVRRRERLKYTSLPSLVPVSSELKRVLAGWLPLVQDQWAFPGRGGEPLGLRGSKTIFRDLAAAGRAVGIKGEVSFRPLRRFFLENPHLVMASRVGPPHRRQKRRPSIEIKDGTAFIRGTAKCPLTPAQRQAISLLLEAWPRRLSTEEMNSRTQRTAWHKTLRRMREDSDWRSEILFPGPRSPGAGYGINAW
jgi:integrase